MTRSITDLERHLTSSNKQVRLKALKLIFRHPDAAAFKIVHALSSPDIRNFQFWSVFELWTAMQEARHRIRGADDEKIYAYLSGLYAADPVANGGHVAHMLELLCTARALRILEEMRESAPQDRGVRWSVNAACLVVSNQTGLETSASPNPVAERFVVSKSEVSRWVALLNSDVPGEAQKAAEALHRLLRPKSLEGTFVNGLMHKQMELEFGKIRGSEVLNPLLETLVNGTDFARAHAASVLGFIKEPRALPLLLDSLTAPVSGVRVGAVRALGFFRDLSTVDALIQTLRDPSCEVRQAAASTLGSIGSRNAVPALEELYSEGNAADKIIVLHSFGEIGDRDSLPIINSALVHSNRQIRSAAKHALAKYALKTTI
jgi:hypothetical protein